MRGRRAAKGEKEFAYQDMDVYTAILGHIMSQWLAMNSLPPCFSHPQGKRSFNFSRKFVHSNCVLDLALLISH